MSWELDDDELEEKLLFDPEKQEEDDDYHGIGDTEQGFLTEYTSGPFARIFQAIGLPILAAIASTLLISIPNLESIPLLGYFKKTIAFVSVVSYLVVLILMIIMFNSENTYFKLQSSTQVFIILAICGAALLFNFLFELDKQPKSKKEMLLSVINAYSNGMADYNKDWGISRTEKHFSGVLNTVAVRIMKIPDKVLTYEQKQNIIEPTKGDINEINNEDTSFVKVHKILNELFNQEAEILKDLEPRQKVTELDKDLNDKKTKFETAWGIFTEVDNKINNTDIATFIPDEATRESYTETIKHIEAVNNYYDQLSVVGRKIPLIEEAHRKLKRLLCENKPIDWDEEKKNGSDIGSKLGENNPSADGGGLTGVFKARYEIGCTIEKPEKDTFTQPFATINLKENPSIQDMIDMGKIV